MDRAEYYILVSVKQFDGNVGCLGIFLQGLFPEIGAEERVIRWGH